LSWFDDPNNEQGADNVTDTPGNLIDSFTDMSTEIVDSFAHDGNGVISDSGPFSMTEEAVFTLTPFGQLINRGQTEVKSAVPEPSTWAMMLLGFAGLGYAGFRKGRSARSIVQWIIQKGRLRAAFFVPCSSSETWQARAPGYRLQRWLHRLPRQCDIGTDSDC
jgi:hypothetical protein